MKPYFDTNHVAGLLILIVVLVWGMMELAEFSQGGKGGTELQESVGAASGSPRAFA